MPSKLILDPAEPGVSEVISNAKVGEPLVLRDVSVVPTVITTTSFEADVGAITVDSETPPATEAEAPQTAMPMSTMPKGEAVDEGQY